jgi:predicted aspartyl protease
VAHLALVAHNVMPVLLADGSIVQSLHFEAEVQWGDERKPILIQVAPNVPLVGMTLLEGHRLTIDVEEDGVVQISPNAS